MAGVWLMARGSACGVGEQGMLEPFGVLRAFLANGDADWMGDFVFVLFFFFFFGGGSGWSYERFVASLRMPAGMRRAGMVGRFWVFIEPWW